MVVGIETTDSLNEVAKTLRDIEFTYGREKEAKKFSPRTLDLDLLIYDDLIVDEPAQIPRNEITQNAFVLWPLAEIAPDTEHPVTKETFGELWQQYNKQSQQLTKIPFSWSNIMDNQNT
jgi:2-amino-4-hydroxy-6-hydroxymethyldihydropteridine diphosphokinase